MIEVTVPDVGESITEVQIGQWLKAEGEWVNEGEDLVEIETEKASVQIPAKTSGYLRNVLKNKEDFALVGEVIASLDPSGSAQGKLPEKISPAQDNAPPMPAPPTASVDNPAAEPAAFVLPAAQRLIDDLGLDVSKIAATGPGGRLLKEDVQRYVATAAATPAVRVAATPPPLPPSTPTVPPTGSGLRTIPAVGELPNDRSLVSPSPHRSEELKPMSMLRRTIAARLVQAQQTAALLTTFNEVDMQPVMSLRNKYRDAFFQRHKVKLGFMSFFAKAAVEALKTFPAVNAEIRGNQIVYRYYQDIGIAIGGGKGLVVPILRNVERLSFADIERQIADYATAASENRIQPQDLEGGTFTISNGGIYGSLLSTPIVNPPQSGILGLHSIQERPIAVDGQVVIRPMMYLALTYDHRIVDGREAVTFLKTIKDVIEDPARLFLEV
jgi:2-oxoglutarate dehydrogenase E2 component (dihydrolipoamide succinyltransferase)